MKGTVLMLYIRSCPALMPNWYSRRLAGGLLVGVGVDSAVGSIPCYANLSTVREQSQGGQPGPKLTSRFSRIK